MKYILSALLFSFLIPAAVGQKLPGFRNSESFDEQQLVIEDSENGTRILKNDSLIIPVRKLNIPVRDLSSESGSEFMNRIRSLSAEEREEEIYKAVSSGNMPDFLRDPVTMSGEFCDSHRA